MTILAFVVLAIAQRLAVGASPVEIDAVKESLGPTENSIRQAVSQSRATVKRTPIAARSDIVGAFFSADSQHYAIVVRKGSRMVVNVDGVEGPIFDDIPGVAEPRNRQPEVVFSPDGLQSAYLALRGNTYIVVRNQKEVSTHPALLDPSAANRIVNLGFTADGSTLLFVEQVALAQPYSLGFRVVANGTPGPVSYNHSLHARPYVLAPVGDGFASEVTTIGPRGEAIQHVSINGSSRLIRGENPRYSATGEFVLMDRDRQMPTAALLINGTVAIRGYADILSAPRGNATLFRTSVPGQSLVNVRVNDKILGQCGISADPLAETRGYDDAMLLNRAAFSPNGENVVYACSGASFGTGVYALMPGVRHPPYDQLHDLYILDDGRPIYVGSKAGLNYLMIGATEYPGVKSLTINVINGRLVGRGWTVGGEPFAQLDSVRYLFRRAIPMMPFTSADGRRVVWFAEDDALWVDGKKLAIEPVSDPQLAAQARQRTNMAFSRDGARYAVAADGKVSRQTVLIVDGKVKTLVLGKGYDNGLAFSPDGKHLYWRERQGLPLTIQFPALMLDGERVLTLDSQWRSDRYPRQGQTVDSLGVFRGFTVEDGKVVHLTVTPSASRTVDDWLR